LRETSIISAALDVLQAFDVSGRQNEPFRGARERPVRVAEVAARPAACRVRSSGPSGTLGDLPALLQRRQPGTGPDVLPHPDLEAHRGEQQQPARFKRRASGISGDWMLDTFEAAAGDATLCAFGDRSVGAFHARGPGLLVGPFLKTGPHSSRP
jgi:hypothetical protein